MDDSGVRVRPEFRFHVAAVAGRPAIPAVDFHALCKRRRVAVVAIDQVRALVVVAMAGEGEVCAVAVEQLHGVLAHLDHFRLGIRVVDTLAVRRMVPVGDDPVLRRRSQILREPGHHRAACGSITADRVEDDEVNISVVERVIGLGTRRLPSRLGRRGQGKDVEIDAGLRRRISVVRVVVAQRRPEDRFAQHGGVHLEHGGLVLEVGPLLVRVVAEHQPQIGMPRAVERVVRVTHRFGIGIGGSGVAENPDSSRFRRPGEGRRDEEMAGVAPGQSLCRRPDRIVVARVAVETREGRDVFGRQPRGDVRW